MTLQELRIIEERSPNPLVVALAIEVRRLMALLPPGHVAVPRELLERVCTPDKLAFRAIDELRELLGLASE